MTQLKKANSSPSTNRKRNVRSARQDLKNLTPEAI